MGQPGNTREPGKTVKPKRVAGGKGARAPQAMPASANMAKAQN